MSTDVVRKRCEFADEHCRPPAFELRFLFDNLDDPDEVTVFPADKETLLTTWISVDVDTAVSLEGVR